MAERGRGRGILAVVALALIGGIAFLLLRGSGAPAPTIENRPPPAVPSRAPAPVVPPEAPTADAEPTAATPESDLTKPAEPGVGTLVVTVFALPASTPIEGATVLVRDGSEEAGHLATGTTGPDGVARFEGIQKDETRVDARAPGRVPGKTWVSDIRKPGEHAAKIELEPGDALGGVVLAAKDRRPLGGAKVVVEFGGDIGFMSSMHSDPEHSDTVADAEGRFRVDGIPRKEIVTFLATAPGYVCGRRSLMLGEGAEGHPAVELLLEEGCSAEGAVLDPDGTPVPGARVWAWAIGRDAGEDALARLERTIGAWASGGGYVGETKAAGETKSGSDGRFAFDGLPVGTSFRFVARGGAFARSRVSDPPVVAEAPGQVLRVDVRLRRPSVLLVKVFDPQGAGVKGASVEMEDEMVGVREKDGAEHRFDSLIAGEYRMEVRAPGFDPLQQTASLGEAETKEVRVELVPVKPSPPSVPVPGTTAPQPGTARFRIVVPSGETSPARVVVATEDIKGRSGGSSPQSPENGVVEVILPAGVATRVSFTAEGYAPAFREVELGDGETRDFGDVPLDQGAEFSGSVRDAEGKPVAGARLMVDLPAFQHAVGTTGADGRFRISRLPTMELWVRIGAPGLLDGEDKVAIVAGGVTRDYTLVPVVTVKGSVKGADGKAPKGVSVSFELQGESPSGVDRDYTGYLEDDGAFAVELAAGAYVVEVTVHEGGEVLLRRELTVDAKAPPRVDLTLP